MLATFGDSMMPTVSPLASAVGLSFAGSLGGLLCASLLLLLPASQRHRLVPWLVSYAVGALLGVALMALLPEALESQSAPKVFGTLLVGILAFFILLCLLADGAGIWRWTLRLFPRKARRAADGAGRAGWVTVVNYARTQLLVATIDAVGIGLGAFLLGVPLAIPVAVQVTRGRRP